METEEVKRLNEVFSFRRNRPVNNRLVNKNIPGVAVDENANVVECRDSETEPTVLLGSN